MGLGSSRRDGRYDMLFCFSVYKDQSCTSFLAPVFSVRGRLYRILDTIGQGSEATVYRCEDQNAAQYAVKVFYFSRYPPVDLRQRVSNFKKEANLLRLLSARSTHFVHLIDFEYKSEENFGYMIM